MKKSLFALFVLCYCSLRHSQAQQWDSIANFNQVISDLKTFDSKLFVGGNFTKIGGATCYWSAYYNGSNFTAHTSMIGGTGIDQLEVFGTELYAVGGLTFFSSIGVGVWNGSTWDDGGSTNYSHGLIHANGNDLYVASDDDKIRKKTGAGSFQPFYNFTGSDWVSALYSYNGNLIVAGSFDSVAGVAANNIAMWNGSTWQPLGTGTSTGISCMAVYNGELYVAGSISNAGGVTAKKIAKWNGSTWSGVGGGFTGTAFNGIRDMVVFNGNLIVVGDIDQMGGVNTGNVAVWNGSSWSGLGLTHDDSFVQCAEVFNNNLYVGTFDFTRSHVFRYSSGVDIDENEKTAVAEIYPNPFSDQFTVELSDNHEAIFILYDFLGRQILERTFTSSTRIYTEQLIDGIYFYELRNNKGVIKSGKVVK